MSMAQMPMIDEFDALFQELGDVGSAFYKFFDLFRINLGDSDADGMVKGIHYGKDCSWGFAPDDQLKQLKSYWKAQRSWCKKEGKGMVAAEARRRMWFFVQKLKEWGIFEMRVRRDIAYWMDTAMERTIEGHMVRVEYLHGEPAVAKMLKPAE